MFQHSNEVTIEMVMDEERSFNLPSDEQGINANISERKKSLLEQAEVEANNPLLVMLSANRENRVFVSSQEADAFIEELRSEWTN